MDSHGEKHRKREKERESWAEGERKTNESLLRGERTVWGSFARNNSAGPEYPMSGKELPTKSLIVSSSIFGHQTRPNTTYQSPPKPVNQPKSGSMLLYSRKKVRYRRDGYCWKKRKDGKTTREDHMKLKVQGMECIYGCYVHSAILPTFHRRCYWLLQNPDIVLVHYLNVPYPDDNKLVIASSVSLWGEKKEWTKEELISQLKPMFFSEEEPDLNNELEISTAETVEAIVTQLMEKQRAARTAALNKQLECGCPDSTNPEKSCGHVRKVQATKSEAHTTSGTTGHASGGGPGTGGRAPSSRSTHHRRMLMQQRMQQQRLEGNQFFKANDRYYGSHPSQGNGPSSYSQVSSTTGNVDSRQSPGTPSPQNQPMNPSHLVLSVSQIQTNNGLLILNNQNHHNQPYLPQHPAHPNPHQHHSTGMTNLHAHQHPEQAVSSNQSDSVDSHGSSRNSPSATTSVSSALRSLNNLSDFALENNGNYEPYSVTDTLLSAGGESDSAHGDSRGANRNTEGNPKETTMPSGNTPLLDFKSAFPEMDSKSEINFHHEPLDNDDISRTLQANMPSSYQQKAHPQNLVAGHHGPVSHSHGSNPHGLHSHGHHSNHHPVDLNPMEFIEHDVVNPSAAGFDVSLDPFNMLDEFSDLDGNPSHYTHAHGSSMGPSGSVANHPNAMAGSPPGGSAMLSQHLPGPMLSSVSGGNAAHHKNGGLLNHAGNRELVQITDYSPEWAWPDGGIKILVTGPWHHTASSGYQILFDDVPVPTSLVQNGVLRCYAPAHKVGEAQLEVAQEGQKISSPVIFEYKPVAQDETLRLLPPFASIVMDAEINQCSPAIMSGSSSLEGGHSPTKPSTDSTLIKNLENDFMKREKSVFMIKNNVAIAHDEEKNLSYHVERILKFNLWKKLESIVNAMTEEETNGAGNAQSNHLKMEKINVMENSLVSIVQSLASATKVEKRGPANSWKSKSETPNFVNLKSPSPFWSQDDETASQISFNSDKPNKEEQNTLLHITAALGYTKLTCSLLQWSDENPYALLSKEINALAQDQEGFTPLMRACLNGKEETALLLYHWNPLALKVLNYDGESCFDLAAPYDCLCSQLEKFERIRHLSEPSGKTDEFAKPSSVSSKKLDETHPDPSGGLTSLRKIRSTSPASLARSFRSVSPSMQQPLTVNVDFPTSTGVLHPRRRLSKRSSFDSGINMHQGDGFSRPFLDKKDAKTAAKSSFYLRRNASSDKVFQKPSQENPRSPIIDVEGLSDEDQEEKSKKKRDSVFKEPTPEKPLPTTNHLDEVEDQRVLTLAEQFIAAMPDRIKNESESEPMLICYPSPQAGEGTSIQDNSQSDDLGVESMCDDLDVEFDFNFEETCSYRENFTPNSSLSPNSSCLQSPASYTFESPSPCGSRSFSVDFISPPCTTADLQEFLMASAKCEKDLSNLTLSDQEQRELYEAAQIIQKAYRSYKGRKMESEYQEKEAKAAVVIQNYYRRYKQYLYWKQMAKAATVIQNKYRIYCEHKRFKKSQEAATCIQNYYRTYKEHRDRPRGSRESTPSSGLKRTYSQRRQHQAAKKIQQFMRKTHLRPPYGTVFVLRRCGPPWRLELLPTDSSPVFRKPLGLIGAAERAGPGCFTCSTGSSGPNSSSSGNSGPHGGLNPSNHAASANGRKREAVGHFGPAGSIIPPKLSSAAAAYANSQTGVNVPPPPPPPPPPGGSAAHMKALPPHATSAYYSLQQPPHHHHHHINSNFMAGVGAHGQHLNGNTGSYYGWVTGPNGHPGAHHHHHPHHNHPIHHHHPIVNGAQK
ncbi:calmodulin-binding transcription activator 1-like isoform X2 [Tigriopus californicus]|uniref:calmodulin-binding transcription activator 1-like isoform X2 n=1 Tax=Tigriopus californicus TaxID=6832 RepID=UPI0027DA377A|nr:calmodulin-binding transcription activator 1-like isoform X2 [Tigriopus californicus]